MSQKAASLKQFIPIMLSFFVMGTVDLVGISKNYIQKDFSLDDFTSSIIPLMVFVWFVIFSIPTGLLMNRISRKKTVLIATVVKVCSLLTVYLFYNFYAVIAAFALLGIGNTIMQVSLNPLVASIVSKERAAGTLTLGQFVKAIASFFGPIVASVGAKQYGDWKLVFLAFTVVSLLSMLWLYLTPIEEKESDRNEAASFGTTLALLKSNTVSFVFLGILLVVGIDVGINTFTPQLLEQRVGLSPDDAALGSSWYFASRTVGAFLGAFLLMRFNSISFLKVNMAVAVVSFLLLMFGARQWVLLTGVVLIGSMCANVFSILFSLALQAKPSQANEISSLMIMGVAGGAVVIPVAGLLSKHFGLASAFGLLMLCGAYILFLSFWLERKSSKA